MVNKDADVSERYPHLSFCKFLFDFKMVTLSYDWIFALGLILLMQNMDFVCEYLLLQIHQLCVLKCNTKPNLSQIIVKKCNMTFKLCASLNSEPRHS